MPLNYTKPDKRLHRELRRVAELAHDIERAIETANFLPEAFPTPDVLSIIYAIEALPDGTAEGCKEPLRYAQERLADIGHHYIQIDEDDAETSIDPDAANPSLVRGGAIDRAFTSLIGAIAYARSEYIRQAGEIGLDEDDEEERPLTPDGRQAEVLGKLDEEAEEIGKETSAFCETLDDSGHFMASDRVDSLKRQSKDIDTHLDLVKQAVREKQVKLGALDRLGNALSKIPIAVEKTWKSLQLSVDLTEIGVKHFANFTTEQILLPFKHIRAFSNEIEERVRKFRDEQSKEKESSKPSKNQNDQQIARGNQKYNAYIIYTHRHNQYHKNIIEHVGKRVNNLIGNTIESDNEFQVFFDSDNPKTGGQWIQRLNHITSQINFFVPVLSPGYLSSKYCLYALREFMVKENDLGRRDLIVPIIFMDFDYDSIPNKYIVDSLLERKHFDWRSLRFEGVESEIVAKAADDLARHITDAVLA